MNWIPTALLLLVSISEVFLCSFMALRFTVSQDTVFSVKQKIIYCVGIVCAGLSIFLNKSIMYFSRPLVIIEIVMICLFLFLMFSKLKMILFSLSTFFILLIAYLDISVSFFLLSDNVSNIVEILKASTLKRNLSYLIVRVFVVIIYFTLKKYGNNIHITINRHKYLLLTIDFVGIIGFWFFHYNLMKENSKLSISNNFLILFLVICVFMIFCIYSIWSKNNEHLFFLQSRNDLVEHNYSKLLESQNKNKYVYHDLKNHLILLQEFIRNKEYEKVDKYINQISTIVKSNEYKQWTGHKVIDIILNDKYNEALKNFIDITVEISSIDIKRLQIADYDLCIIIANLLDNALEACDGIIDAEPWVKVFIGMKGNIFIFKIENNYNLVPVKRDGKYISQKQEKGLHGLGLESVEDAVGRYNGNLFLEHNKEAFTASVSLFL